MILNAVDVIFFAGHTFYRVIKKVYMSNAKACSRKTFLIYGIGMVLACYLNFICNEVFNRVISTSVSKLQLVCLCSVGKGNNLMPEADSKYRVLAFYLSYCTYDRYCVLRVAGAV